MMMTPLLAQAAANQGSGGGVLIGTGLIFIALGLLYLAAWLYALFSAVTRSDFDFPQRLLWIALLIVLPGLGTLLYFLLAGRGRA